MTTPYIAIIDPSAALLCGIIDDYQSLRARSVLSDTGDWTLTLPASAANIALLRTGRMIDAGRYCGLIEDISIAQGEDGADAMTVSGVDLAGLLSRRLALPADGAEYAEYSGDAASVMAQLVVDNCIDAPLEARNYPQMVLGVVDNAGADIVCQARYERLSDLMRDIALANGLSWSVDYEGGSFVISIRRVEYHGAGSALPVVYSPEYDNVSGQSYALSMAGSANSAIVAGTGTGAEREVCWVGDGSAGLERREEYLSLRTYSDLSADGLRELHAQYAPVRSFEGTLLDAGPFEYEVHWRLGDTIALQHLGWGISMDVQVTAVEWVYEGDVPQMYVTFGDGRITIVDAVRRAISPALGELRR